MGNPQSLDLKKRESLQKTILLTKDIEIIFGYTTPKARKLKSEALRKYNGSVPFNKHAATAESVFKAANVDRNTEIKALLGGNEDASVQ